jgi:hypothetical protein
MSSRNELLAAVLERLELLFLRLAIPGELENQSCVRRLSAAWDARLAARDRIKAGSCGGTRRGETVRQQGRGGLKGKAEQDENGARRGKRRGKARQKARQGEARGEKAEDLSKAR